MKFVFILTPHDNDFFKYGSRIVQIREILRIILVKYLISQ